MDVKNVSTYRICHCIIPLKKFNLQATKYEDDPTNKFVFEQMYHMRCFVKPNLTIIIVRKRFRRFENSR